MISTCEIPDGVDCGRSIDMLISGLTLPENPVPFKLTGAGMTVEGTTNGWYKDMLYRYPQISMKGFAISEVDPAARKAIVDQLHQQLDSLPQRQAVDKLLQFVQQITEYTTDGNYHGFEKPYFMEEMLVYPKSDCEDRAIFYTYLLNRVLGVDNHLIAYPGHESASVCLDEPISGDSYTYDGRTFYISDPTYIGARTGMCMPNYRTTEPKIDHYYKK